MFIIIGFVSFLLHCTICRSSDFTVQDNERPSSIHPFLWDDVSSQSSGSVFLAQNGDDFRSKIHLDYLGDYDLLKSLEKNRVKINPIKDTDCCKLEINAKECRRWLTNDERLDELIYVLNKIIVKRNIITIIIRFKANSFKPNNKDKLNENNRWSMAFLSDNIYENLFSRLNDLEVIRYVAEDESTLFLEKKFNTVVYKTRGSITILIENFNFSYLPDVQELINKSESEKYDKKYFLNAIEVVGLIIFGSVFTSTFLALIWIFRTMQSKKKYRLNMQSRIIKKNF